MTSSSYENSPRDAKTADEKSTVRFSFIAEPLAQIASWDKWLKQELLILVALLALVLLLRLPSIQQPFENDSGAIAYHARLIARGEPLYSSHHPAHHMPGAYYVYAGAFRLLGDYVQSVRSVLLLWIAITVYLIYRLGAVVVDRVVGLVAAIFAALLFSSLWLAGTNTKIESFVGLPQVAAVLILLHLVQKPGKSWYFAFVGLFSAATFLFKANYLSSLILAAIVLLVDLWRRGSTTAAWRTAFSRGFWLATGFAGGLLPVLVYFGSAGLLSRFVRVFTIGLEYTQLRHSSLSDPAYLVLYPLLVFAKNNALILIAGLAGLVFIMLGRARNYPTETQQARQNGQLAAITYIAIWFVLNFVETSVSRVFLLNYYLVFVPSLSLLAAWFVCKSYRDISKHIKVRLAPTLLAVPVLLSFLMSLHLHADYYYHYYGRYLLGRATYTEFLIAGLPEGVGQTMVAIQELADYIDSHSAPSDTIYYWSNLMELYYVADRRSAVDIIWPLYIEATGSRERLFDAEYIVLGDIPLGYSDVPEWLRSGLEEKYELETVLHGQLLYRQK